MSKLPVPKGSKSVSNISPLQMYLNEISKYPLLEPEEEFEIASEYYASQDTKSAHRLITSNLRLVVKIANDFKQAQSNLLDMIQEGNYGLMQAVKRFNPYKGVKLSSYSAWWIRAYILKYIMDNKSQIRIGTTAAQRKLFFNLRKETEKLLKEYEAVDTKLLAERLDVKEKDVVEMQQRLNYPEVSLDAPLGQGRGEDSTTTRGELISDDKPAIDELLSDSQAKSILRESIVEFRSQLKEREIDFLDSRLLNEDPCTLQDMGKKYGISRERARQIEARIIEKLRNFIQEKGTLDI